MAKLHSQSLHIKLQLDAIPKLTSATMDFGSTFALSKTVNPAVDFEEIDESDYSAGVRTALDKNINSRGNNMCLLDIFDTYVVQIVSSKPSVTQSHAEQGKKNSLVYVNNICRPHKPTSSSSLSRLLRVLRKPRPFIACVLYCSL